MGLSAGGLNTTGYIPGGAEITYDSGGFQFAWPLTPVLIASLPSASAAGAGARAICGDVTTVTFGTTVVGTGTIAAANTCPIYSNGSVWKAG